MTNAAINLDRFKSKRATGKPPASAPVAEEAAPARPQYAKVFLADMLDRRNDVTFSAYTRLLVYLTIKSHAGKRVVRLTNTKAAEIGLTRLQKLRGLRHLELQGYVTVERNGQEAPQVTFVGGG